MECRGVGYGFGTCDPFLFFLTVTCTAEICSDGLRSRVQYVCFSHWLKVRPLAEVRHD